ncbi:MAG: DUF2339 domain-containing protein [Woeseiaceae bacterium]|nr:DUF2339 domain-containing protein [Woeseiaceae bacterium]MDX2607489.1 DUF2339 domain-containing protein [Woeseiaceae bacterium]
MQDRVAELESRLAVVEQRLRVLEGASAAEPAAEQVAPDPTFGDGFVSSASTHIGRVLLIFGGAYLLRAITDFQFVPTAVGISLGAIYAFFWLVMAYRKGRITNQRANAAFFGGTSVLLTLPLLVEATGRFELLSGPQSIIALTFFCAVAMLVAVAHNLRSLAWLVTGGGLATAFAVLNASHSSIPVAAFLILLGLGSLWAVYKRGWMGPQWLGALGANAGVLVLTVLSNSDQWTVEPLTVFVLAATLLVLYLTSFAIHSHLRGKDVGIFELVQTVVSIGVTLWVASIAVQAGHIGIGVIGILSLIFGAGGYVLAFTPETRTVRGRNFFFYSTMGLLFVVAGSALALSPGNAAALWSLMALIMAWSSGRFDRVTLSLQCTFLLLAAGVGSGILTTGWQALGGDVAVNWPPLQLWHLAVALTTVACLFIPVAQRSERWGVAAGLPQLIVLALSVWEVGGLMVVYLAPLLAQAGGAEPNLGVLAALRTAVLSVSSVTLALSSRYKRWPESRWLVYPVLILVAIKLFIEDFPNGQPATLFVALAFVGSSLLLVAKLLKRGESLGSD